MEESPKLPRTLSEHWADSMLDSGNAAYLEELYDDYLKDPNSVSETWRDFFSMLVPGALSQNEISHAHIREAFRGLSRTPVQPAAACVGQLEYGRKQVHVLQLINAYRFRGHQWADIDPLDRREFPDIPELRIDHHNLDDTDLTNLFNTGSLVGPEEATLQEILDIVQMTYCGSIGAEYMHIPNTVEKRWIQEYLESRQGAPSFDEEYKRHILDRLIAAEGIEQFLHSRYVGQKRFSLEGGESLIPCLDELIQRGGKQDVREIAIGMAHRGRLNVLVNIMGKIPAELFQEFEGKRPEKPNGTGDVKYHSGFTSNVMTPGGPVHLVLAFNPSHLEIVGPVVEGSVRARQDQRQDKDGKQVIPVLIHGDAAFSGQGVVMETFNMSQSRGYSTKGTIHIVINNQIGFTNSAQEDSRSTLYCADVAKMVNAPIFHVNGDDPEAVVLVAQLAMDYRMMFLKDVVIDLVCYRRQGHSEADEPMVTQPMMYKRIRQMPTTRARYAEKLIEEGITDIRQVEQEISVYRDALAHGECVVKEYLSPEQANYPAGNDWQPYKNNDCFTAVNTAVSHEELLRLQRRLEQLPDGFRPHPAVARIIENRTKMANGEIALDWGFAETMAYATLLDEGYAVRLSGQDSGRGTFFHRHALLLNQEDGSPYIPLRNLAPDQANFLVINSLLSEEAVLAFEYGYATTDPMTLTIWEAQFGDFANNAQVVIDQFISAGEQKWCRLCGLVMFLPHGFEGQGPEHSSARLERYLQLCAQFNIQVCIPSSAAQIFHLLRRQMMRHCRRPLIVMTPKSLLRLPAACSPLAGLTEGRFEEVLPDEDDPDVDKVRHVILCSGRVYYELLQKRRDDNREDVAIIRLEQLYPFPEEQAKQAIGRYTEALRYVWCQEEPMNQGAWYPSQHHLRNAIGREYHLVYAGRPLLAAPAVGYASLHRQQLEQLVEDALGQPME
jgi:2-oxoglutarate dehydrogenase E1 component